VRILTHFCTRILTLRRQIPAEAENPSPAPAGDKKSLLRHLEKTSPEALALARDWDDTIQSLEKAKQKIAKYVAFMNSCNPA